MASSSVSQDDFEKNDFEKLERRSRIRTARARQINPQVKAAPNITIPNVDHNDIRGNGPYCCCEQLEV